MDRLRYGFGCEQRVAVALAVLTVAVAARPAHARQVLLIANSGGNSVGAYDPNTGAAINANLITGVNNPAYLAADGNGHVFVNYDSVTGFRSVGEYDVATGAAINPNFLPPLHSYGTIALDTNNNLFAGGSYGGGGPGIGRPKIGEFDATTGAPINSTFTLNAGGNMIVRSDNVLLAQTGLSTIGAYDAATGATINPSLFTTPGEFAQMTIGPSNHLFAVDTGQSTVRVYDAMTGAAIYPYYFLSASLVPVDFEGIAVDNNNHAFVADFLNGRVIEYDVTTGYIINPNFITGLQSPEYLLLVNPVPEPSSLLLIAAAAVAATCRHRILPEPRSGGRQ